MFLILTVDCLRMKLMFFSSLTVMFNHSILCSHRPSDWKRPGHLASIKAKAPRTTPENYRPLFVVELIPKILKNAFRNNIVNILTYSLLTCDQSAFKHWLSSTSAVHKQLDDVLDDIDQVLVNGACSFDLSKCFDNIDHPLLLAKMEKKMEF